MPRNVGDKRIDAAYDALVPLGFSRAQIKKTIESLRKVYGGNAAWPFIEEGSYRLLIETLLEDQEKDNGKRLRVESGEPSSKKDYDTRKQTSEPLEKEEIDQNKKAIEDSYNENELLEAPNEKSNLEDAECAGNGSQPQIVGVEQKGLSEFERKGCYGWLSDDDSDEVFTLVSPNEAETMENTEDRGGFQVPELSAPHYKESKRKATYAQKQSNYSNARNEGTLKEGGRRCENGNHQISKSKSFEQVGWGAKGGRTSKARHGYEHKEAGLCHRDN